MAANGKKNGGPVKPVKVTVKRLTELEKQTKALQLRCAGVTLREIAIQLGYSHHSGAQYAVDAALKNTYIEPNEDLRKLELERLDLLMVPLFMQARQSNLGAVDRVLKIMERRARLTGLDKPVAFSVDWREEAKRHGLDPIDVLEQVVSEVLLASPQGVGKS